MTWKQKRPQSYLVSGYFLTTDEHEDRVVNARWHPFLPIIVTTSADCTFKIYATEYFLNEFM